MTEFKRNSLTSALSYRDPAAALDWLEKAFGFERAMVITDKEGNIGHAEMRFQVKVVTRSEYDAYVQGLVAARDGAEDGDLVSADDGGRD